MAKGLPSTSHPILVLITGMAAACVVAGLHAGGLDRGLGQKRLLPTHRRGLFGTTGTPLDGHRQPVFELVAVVLLGGPPEEAALDLLVFCPGCRLGQLGHEVLPVLLTPDDLGDRRVHLSQQLLDISFFIGMGSFVLGVCMSTPMSWRGGRAAFAEISWMDHGRRPSPAFLTILSPIVGSTSAFRGRSKGHPGVSGS